MILELGRIGKLGNFVQVHGNFPISDLPMDYGRNFNNERFFNPKTHPKMLTFPLFVLLLHPIKKT
jgi:hypothetical protein